MDELDESGSVELDKFMKNNEEVTAGIELLKKLSTKGEAYIVGGAVRDILLGKTPNDIDIVTSLTPEEVDKYFPNQHDIGKNKEFGISVVRHNGHDYEVATYRKDEYDDNEQSGKGATSTSKASSFKDDVVRRDFTINGLGIDKDGNIVDLVKGGKDITDKLIRAIGDPNDRFGEDYVRMLRAVRFKSKLDFDIEPETADAIKKQASNITNVAPERITKEFMKMAANSGSKFADAIRTLKDLNLLQYIIPEIAELANKPHSPEHHPEAPDVLGHVLAALEQNDIDDPIVNLAILFHDVGKLNTHTVGDDGMHHYLKHASKAENLINTIASRLKMDNRTKDAMLFAAINHMKFKDILKMNPQNILKLMDSPYWDVLLKTAEADARSKGELFDEENWEKITAHLAELRNKYGNADSKDSPLKNLKNIVNGNLVMKIRNIKPSREVGDVIDATIDYIMKNNIDFNDQNAVIDVIKNIKV
jgi:tRNA nucleotidyltransferase/poly(A) polymerase